MVVGVLAGGIGLLPWLATGEVLPLQNLWRVDVLPDAMPWAMLPLSQYYLEWVIALLAVPGLLAGLLLRRPFPPAARLWASLGLLVVQLAAVSQSLAVLVPGLTESPLATAYIAGLVVTCLFGVVLGQVVLAMVTLRVRWLVTIGFGLAAVPLSSWVLGLLRLLLGQFGVPTWATIAAWWLPALVVGAALAWCGLGSRGQATAWIVALVLLWIAPAALQAVGFAVARNTVRQGPLAVLESFLGMFAGTLGSWGQVTQGVLLALVIGSVGTGLVRVARRRSAAPAGAGSGGPSDNE